MFTLSTTGLRKGFPTSIPKPFRNGFERFFTQKALKIFGKVQQSFERLQKLRKALHRTLKSANPNKRPKPGRSAYNKTINVTLNFTTLMLIHRT